MSRTAAEQPRLAIWPEPPRPGEGTEEFPCEWHVSAGIGEVRLELHLEDGRQVWLSLHPRYAILRAREMLDAAADAAVAAPWEEEENTDER